MFKVFLTKSYKDIAKKTELEDDVIKLVKNRFYTDSYNGAMIENYAYLITMKASGIPVGYCDLRVGDEVALKYLGNIGYNIFEHKQGQGLAAHAAQLLVELARKMGLKRITITCNTDNIASVKTIEKLGAVLVDTLNVPADEPLFHQGDYVKYIYRVDLIKENEHEL